ncbi:MAG: 4-hydroxythreonine-4-phosphate dehydrogenase PdxA, partial [Microcystaceae cyanobacterium]
MRQQDETRSLSPHLAITLGDPAGIGPEIILKAFADPVVRETCPMTIIGSRSLLQATYQQLQQVSTLGEEALANPDTLSIQDVPLEEKTIAAIKLGIGNAA